MQPVDIHILTTYAGPPAIGAFIGYLTNRVAIKMLFRPLKPWKIGGVRVPMTPGVIPSKRHDLAKNIGEMVGEHLLTSKEIGAALSREPFQDHLRDLVSTGFESLMSRELGPVSSFIPEGFQAHYKVAVKILKGRVAVGLENFLLSKDREKDLSDFITRYCHDLEEREFNDIVSFESRKTLYQYLGSLANQVLSSPTAQGNIASFINAKILAEAEGKTTIRELLPGQTAEVVAMAIESNLPSLLEQFGRQLSEPVIKKELLEGISKGVDHFIESLGPVGAMARGFIDMDNLKETVGTYLAEKEVDICDWLQKPLIRKQVSRIFLNQINSVLDRPVADFVDGKEEDVLALSHLIAEQIVIFLSQTDQQQLGAFFEKVGEQWLEQGGQPFAAFINQNEGDGTTISEVVTALVQSFLRSKAAVKGLHLLTEKAIDLLFDRPVGRLDAVVPASVQKGLTDYAVLTANTVILREVPGLVGSLNINQLVTEKVDSLDLLKLERLLLSIMEEQFKYINLFGALLGFLIGCMNVLLLQLA